MKFQIPSFKFFLNRWKNGRTQVWDKPKAICSPLFQSWGHNYTNPFCCDSHIVNVVEMLSSVKRKSFQLTQL